MGERVLKINGRITELPTAQRLAPTRVEAWRVTPTGDRRVGDAEVDAHGRFTITIAEPEIDDVYFSVIVDSAFVLSTKGKRHWTREADEDEVVIDGSSSDPAAPPVPGAPGGVLPAAGLPRPTRITLAFLLRDNVTKAALSGYRVDASWVGGAAPSKLGYAVTDAHGRFVLTATLYAPPDNRLPLELTATDENGRPVLTRRVETPWPQMEPFVVLIAARRPAPAVVSLSSLPGAGSTIPTAFLGTLAKRQIQTLGDVLAAGGLVNSGVQDAAAHVVDAHALLSTLTPDLAVGAELIKEGYTSARAIASTPRSRFVASMGGAVSEAAVAEIHTRARAHSRLVDNAATAQSIARSYGVKDVGNAGWYPARQCQCDACVDALSPSAYLADLIEFVLQRVDVPDPVTASTPETYPFTRSFDVG